MSRIALALLLLIAMPTVARSDEAEELRAKLRHRDPIVRLHAAARLGELAAEGRLHRINFRHERELIDALADPHVMVRFYAADALTNLDSRAWAASGSLAYCVVCDPEWIVSRKAALALWRVNPRLKDVSVESMLAKRFPEGLRAPLLDSYRLAVRMEFERLLQSKEFPNWSAITAETTESLLQRIGNPRGDSEEPAALKTPADRAFFVRFVALLELQRRLPAPTLIPHIVPLLDATDGDLRRIALDILLDRGDPDEELAIHVLAGFPPANGPQALLDKARTNKTIASVRPEDLVSSRLLRRFYDARDVGIQLAVVEAIPRLGLADAETREFLARMCTHADSEMRKYAAAAVRNSGLTEQIVRESFIPDLASDGVVRWKHAWRALREFTPREGETEFIRSLGNHDSPRVRLAAISMLQRAGAREEAEALMPWLVEMLAAPDPWTRSKAAEVLGQMGPLARGAIPALGRALNDEDHTVSSTALDALKAIGTERR